MRRALLDLFDLVLGLLKLFLTLFGPLAGAVAVLVLIHSQEGWSSDAKSGYTILVLIIMLAVYGAMYKLGS